MSERFEHLSQEHVEEVNLYKLHIIRHSEQVQDCVRYSVSAPMDETALTEQGGVIKAFKLAIILF